MTRTSLNAFEYGKYDEILWDNEAKNDVYSSWDPATPRSTQNFNPFETYKGNSPDASGIYPGEPRYKDPVRPEVNFAIMMAEREEAESEQQAQRQVMHLELQDARTKQLRSYVAI